MPKTKEEREKFEGELKDMVDYAAQQIRSMYFRYENEYPPNIEIDAHIANMVLPLWQWAEMRGLIRRPIPIEVELERLRKELAEKTGAGASRLPDHES